MEHATLIVISLQKNSDLGGSKVDGKFTPTYLFHSRSLRPVTTTGSTSYSMMNEILLFPNFKNLDCESKLRLIVLKYLLSTSV